MIKNKALYENLGRSKRSHIECGECSSKNESGFQTWLHKIVETKLCTVGGISAVG